MSDWLIYRDKCLMNHESFLPTLPAYHYLQSPLKFMTSNKYLVDYMIYTNFIEPSHLAFPMPNIGLRKSDIPATLVAKVGQINYSNTLQCPSESCSSTPYVMIMSHCSEGGLPPAVLSILQAIYCNVSLRVAFSCIRLHVYRIGPEMDV